jgi:very-short-patch-repair endonuclease
MPVGPYFADFLCRELGLVVELDGWSHEVRVEHDVARDRWMIAHGLRVLRFSNEMVRRDLESVVAAIREEVAVLLQRREGPPRCD